VLLAEESSALHPVVTLVMTADRVALLQGAAAHSDLSQLSTGVIMDAFELRTTLKREEALRHALASEFAATWVKVVSQVLEIEKAETLVAKRAAVKMRFMMGKERR